MIYTSGASSVKSLPASGWFSFTVPGSPSGVFVGLVDSDASTDPNEHSHSLFFSRGQVVVRENGEQVSGVSSSHSPGSIYSIVRHAGAVFYCRGAPGVLQADARIPFLVPGTVLWASTLPLNGPVFLDATLTDASDTVVGAEMREKTDYNEARLRMAPLVLAASTSDVNSARLSFEPAEAKGFQGDGARISLAAPEIFSRQSLDYNAASAQFPPLQAMGTGDYSPPQGATLFLDYLRVNAGGPGAMLAQARTVFEPLAMKAGDYDYNDARVAFPPMQADASGRHTNGPKFTVVMPAFASALPLVNVLDVFGGEAVASDTLYPSSYALVTEQAVADDAVLLDAETALFVDGGEAVAEGGAEEIHTIELLESEAVAEDEVELSGSTLLLGEAVADSEVLPSSSTFRDLLDSVAVADDAALPYIMADLLNNEAIADDSLVLTAEETLLSEAVAEGDALPSTSSGALLVSEAVADDELSVQVQSWAMVEEIAVADDQVLMKQAGLVAWVMNTSTGAVSWYDNWAFTSMATVGGKVFAAGPEGLSVVGGDADGQDAIDARIDFGWQEFGGYGRDGQPKPDHYKKRVSALWFGYHADNVMTATVETYGGQHAPQSYTMPVRSAAQPRNNRITPGRGLSSRYWRISVNNNNGGDFELHSIAAETVTSTRRL